MEPSRGAGGAAAAATQAPRVALRSMIFELLNPTRGEEHLDVEVPRSDAMTAQFFDVASYADVALDMINKAIQNFTFGSQVAVSDPLNLLNNYAAKYQSSTGHTTLRMGIDGEYMWKRIKHKTQQLTLMIDVTRVVTILKIDPTRAMCEWSAAEELVDSLEHAKKRKKTRRVASGRDTPASAAAYSSSGSSVGGGEAYRRRAARRRADADDDGSYVEDDDDDQDEDDDENEDDHGADEDELSDGDGAAAGGGGTAAGGGGGGGSGGGNGPSARRKRKKGGAVVPARSQRKSKELENWEAVMDSTNHDADEAMKHPLFVPKNPRAKTLEEKCWHCRDQLKRIGDDGSALISPRYVWCGPCGKVYEMAQLGKLHHFKSNHLQRHHSGLGDVMSATNGRTLGNMADGLDAPATSTRL